MASGSRPSSVDYDKKKMAIAGVIDFNDANGIKYSRVKLFKHFGVSVPTGYSWFPVPEGAEGEKPRGRPKSDKNGVKKESPSAFNVKKRRISDSEDSKDGLPGNHDFQVVIKTDPGEPTLFATPSQNSAGNAGRGRKKHKAAVNSRNEQTPFTTPPPPTAPISPPSTANARSPQTEQLPTPPTRKRGRPRKVVVEAQRSESPEGNVHSGSVFEDDEYFAV